MISPQKLFSNAIMFVEHFVNIRCKIVLPDFPGSCRKACMVSTWCYASSYDTGSVCSMTDSLQDGVPADGSKYFYRTGSFFFITFVYIQRWTSTFKIERRSRSPTYIGAPTHLPLLQNGALSFSHPS